MRWGLATLLCLALPAAAGDVVFYRCTDASGALTVQNMPCPKGTQQSTRVMQAVGTPPPMPVPAAAPMPAASQAVQAGPGPVERLYAAPEEPAAPAPAPVPAEPLPPLFECKPRGGDPYLSETPEPPARCVAMQVTGLDGNPRTGAGEACEVLRDSCTPVDPARHCAMWRQRVHEARTASNFTGLAQAEARRREYERLQARFDASDCAAQNP